MSARPSFDRDAYNRDWSADAHAHGGLSRAMRAGIDALTDDWQTITDWGAAADLTSAYVTAWALVDRHLAEVVSGHPARIRRAHGARMGKG